MSNLTRRNFLARSSGLLGVGVCAIGSESFGIEPIKRNGQPFFKFSLAAYSYRNLLKGGNASLTLFDFVDDCAKFGLEGTELTSYYFPDPVTPQYLRELKQHCFRLGLDISGTAIANDFGFNPGEDRNKQIQHVKKWVDYSEILGAPVIRVFAGHTPKGLSDSQAYANMVAGFEECCDYAGQHGVYLALENHGGPTATADGLLSFVRDVKSPWFGVNFDSGNFHSDNVYGDLARIAPYALNAQIKVVISGPDKKMSPADFKRFAQIMRDANYRGYIVLEYEESGDPRKESERYLKELRSAFA